MSTLEECIQKRFNEVPSYIKEDLVEAAIWARDTLTRHEGEGHHFEISAERDGKLSCSFAKPEWPGDHSWYGMDTAAEAIVISVVSYLEGG